MTTARNSRIWRVIPLLIAICFVSISPQGLYGSADDSEFSARTSRYIFLSDQSTLVQTGGIAGVHWTYSIEGQFVLTVDFDAGTASFAQVFANAIDDSPWQRTLNPNEVFAMTTLVGKVLCDTTLEFTGKADNGSDVRITVTLQEDLVHLVAETIPPPNSADFFIFNMDAVAQAKYGGGTGEPNDPYLIYTAEQLNAIGAEPNDWDKHFKLMADIDLSAYTGTKYNIIGYYKSSQDSKAFTGFFEGNGYTISNLTWDSFRNGVNHIGLFGYIDDPNAEIKNLGLIDPIINAGTENCVGSLAGYLRNGTITGCYVEGGSVAGNWDVGGLVGHSGGTIANCYAKGDVSGNNGVGGLAGYNDDIIINCYATGSVSGKIFIGGLIGWNGPEFVPFFGTFTITKCNATGAVTGKNTVDSLVGWNGYRSFVTNSYSTSAVFGSESIGGLAGCNSTYGTIRDCYSIGHVLGNENVGGLVGDNIEGGSIVNCYATGRVTGTTDIGGLVGDNWCGSIVTACFWDIETSGLTDMCGIESSSATGCDNSYGKTTAEMQTASTFLDAGWDFVDETENGTEDIWWILEGKDFPRLW